MKFLVNIEYLNICTVHEFHVLGRAFVFSRDMAARIFSADGDVFILDASAQECIDKVSRGIDYVFYESQGRGLKIVITKDSPYGYS